jgi:hypothetical protein
VRTLVIVIAAAALSLLAAYYWIVYMPGESGRRPMGPRALGTADLQRHVHALAVSIGERHVGKLQQLNQTADYIIKQFEYTGLAVSNQAYTAYGTQFRNVVAELGGETDDIIVVGAHYDSVPGSPAANDNASGVATLLKLAALNADQRFHRTIHFVAFANEELPHGGTDAMGSLAYAGRAKQNGEKIIAMISLETIGYYTDEPNSQKYPAPLSWLYPDTGNFVAFVGNLRSRQLVRTVIASFRRHATIGSEGIAAPNILRDIRRSDHASFWRHGYPAIMVTDTAPFRYPYYHTPLDTPDKIDFTRLAQVTAGLNHVIRDLARIPHQGSKKRS